MCMYPSHSMIMKSSLILIHTLMSLGNQWELLRKRNKPVPNHSLISVNARSRYCFAKEHVTYAHQCSVSMIHFGCRWSWDYFGSLCYFLWFFHITMHSTFRFVHCSDEKIAGNMHWFLSVGLQQNHIQSLTCNQQPWMKFKWIQFR